MVVLIVVEVLLVLLGAGGTPEISLEVGTVYGGGLVTGAAPWVVAALDGIDSGTHS